MSKESNLKTVMVATGLSVVCSIALATAVTVLKPIQLENQALDKQRKILAALGVLEEGKGSPAQVGEEFAKLERYLVNMETGEYRAIGLDDRFDMRRAAKDPATMIRIAPEDDIAGLRRMSSESDVYVLRGEGDDASIVLPVAGYGLWSTLYGYLVVKQDANTVVGITFTEHAETPGLGGEVDNPRWKATWAGKQVYNDAGEPVLGLHKNVDQSRDDAIYKVDSLSGATLTSNGVSNLVKFWMGDMGFKKFLDNVRESGV